jgi:environmental stress-induced protein Ves
MTRSCFTLVRHADYRPMPWRNGQGMTLEIAREPVAGEPFAWRLSLADIAVDGPFSPYPGYHRAIVLVSGQSVRLDYHGQGSCVLDSRRRGTRFDGNWRTACTLGNGPCTDLSLIVARGNATQSGCIVRAPAVFPLRDVRSLTLTAELEHALFVLRGAVAVRDAAHRRTRVARERDTVLASGSAGARLILAPRGTAPVQLALLRWRPGR